MARLYPTSGPCEETRQLAGFFMSARRGWWAVRATGASGVAGESHRGRSPLPHERAWLFVGWVELAKPMRLR